jgi:hypothetical protein
MCKKQCSLKAAMSVNWLRKPARIAGAPVLVAFLHVEGNEEFQRDVSENKNTGFFHSRSQTSCVLLAALLSVTSLG